MYRSGGSFFDKGEDVNPRNAIGAAAIATTLIAPGSAIGRESILDSYTPTRGASADTARQDSLPPGPESSQTMAQTDAPQVMRHWSKFVEAGNTHGVDPSILAAIASRESRGGSALKNGWSGNREDFGLIQVNKRNKTTNDDPYSQEHVSEGARIFKEHRETIQQKHPDWSETDVTRGAIASYNFGPKHVLNKDERLDKGTTGDDYSDDVWARAQYYSAHKTPKPKAGQLSHTVGKKETLSKVAKKYKTTVAKLRALNPQITDPSLVFPGENLVVPKGNS